MLLTLITKNSNRNQELKLYVSSDNNIKEKEYKKQC